MRYSCMPCKPAAVGVISTTRPCFLTVGLLHRSCLALASSTKVSCGRKRARMTNTSRNGIGASESLAISSMEAICCSATQRWSSWRRSLSDRWRLDTGRLIAPSQSSLVMAVSNRIHEASRIGAAILSRLGMTLGCVSFRSARPCSTAQAPYQVPEWLLPLQALSGSKKGKRTRPLERTWKALMSSSVKRLNKTWTSSLPLSQQPRGNRSSVFCLETPVRAQEGSRQPEGAQNPPA